MQDLVTFPPTSTLSQSKDLDQQLILGTQTQVTLPLSKHCNYEYPRGGGWQRIGKFGKYKRSKIERITL